MPIPATFEGRLRLPAVSAPMFLASGSALVIETCKNGVVGTFPALNARTTEKFEEWLVEIKGALANCPNAAPFGVNLIVHSSNPRLEADLAMCIKHQVPLIITSLGAVESLISAVHAYGGVVFHDVINVRHAKKAAQAGVDGLIVVAAGAGGHGGTLNPLAFVQEVRSFFDKTLLLGGCISTGKAIAAAQTMGADLAYMGTRFLATSESQVVDKYKQMVLESSADDIMYTPDISGVHANFLRPSIEQAGLDPYNLSPKTEIDFGSELVISDDDEDEHVEGDKKEGAWKNIWSAGQGVGAINRVVPIAELINQLRDEYRIAIEQQQLTARAYLG